MRASRRTRVVLLVISLAIVMTACGGGDDESSSLAAATEPATAPVTERPAATTASTSSTTSTPVTTPPPTPVATTPAVQSTAPATAPPATVPVTVAADGGNKDDFCTQYEALVVYARDGPDDTLPWATGIVERLQAMRPVAPAEVLADVDVELRVYTAVMTSGDIGVLISSTEPLPEAAAHVGEFCGLTAT